MTKQRLNSAGWTVIVLGVVLVLTTVTASASAIALLQGRSQIDKLKGIAEDTRGLLAERVRQNDEAEAQRKADAAELERRQQESSRLVSEAIARIQLNTATSVDCSYLRDHGVRPKECKEVNERIDRLEAGLPIVSAAPTTPTTKPRATTPTTQPSPPTTVTTQQPRTTALPCRGISLLGLCIGG